MWQHEFLQALVTAQNLNLGCAVLCVAMALGLPPRLAGLLGAMLHVGLAFVGI